MSTAVCSVLEKYLQHMWSGRAFNWTQPVWRVHVYSNVRNQRAVQVLILVFKSLPFYQNLLYVVLFVFYGLLSL